MKQMKKRKKTKTREESLEENHKRCGDARNARGFGQTKVMKRNFGLLATTAFIGSALSVWDSLQQMI